MIFKYKGKEFEGTRNEIICQLRVKEKLKQREIAELMGITKSAISLVLIPRGLGGHLKYPELENKDLFLAMSNEEIADKYNIPLYLVVAARRKLGIKTVTINVGTRRKELAEFLFGIGYEPGPMFTDTIIAIAGTLLTKKRAELITTFLKGRLDQAAYERVYRSDARKQLKTWISTWGRDWEGEGVVKKRSITSN